TGDVMTELVHEDVRRPYAVGRDRAVQAVDAAAAVGRAVDENLDDLVRRVGGEVAKRLVLEAEDVALRIERVVGRSDRRAPIDPLRWTRDARRSCGRHESPHVDVTLAVLERRRGKERRDEPSRIALELPALGGRVAVAEDEEVELRRRIAGFVQLD